MAPIPVYTDSPIAAAKASGVTPQTAQPASASKPAATTSSPTSPSQASYPPAQPGAAPSLPTPTTASSQMYVPPQDGPPAPQPGAVPSPSRPTGANLPPPPKAGEKLQLSQQAPESQPPMPYPQQMSIPPPTAPYPSQQRGTAVASAPTPANSSQGPPTSSGSRTYSLEHPPGYHQNTNASELDRYQRSAIQQNEIEDRTEDSGGVWGTAKKWAQQTGEKLAAAENEVWKKINKE
ncbi:hypothetical protein GGS26DRAFT_541619 [Hypomontagnella submonticulosa]|nr:hypothetical protein GGS26DRAFT_541619 [Hypomontagnella submonticulosa]